MSDYADRVKAHEADARECVTRCLLCSGRAAFYLSWENPGHWACRASNMGYCEDCGPDVEERCRGDAERDAKKVRRGKPGFTYRRDDATEEYVQRLVDYALEQRPMRHRSTVGEVA